MLNQLDPSIISVKYDEVDAVANLLLTELGEHETALGYALLGSALLMARLVHFEHHLKDEEEIQFVQDIMEWVKMYWGAGKDILPS